jgi:hypothetical protein
MPERRGDLAAQRFPMLMMVTFSAPPPRPI